MTASPGDGTAPVPEGRGPSRGFSRAFLALGLPSAVRAALACLRRRVKDSVARVTWVAEPDYHLTLAFIGDLCEEKLSPLRAALGDAVSGCAPFRFEVRGLGWFGPPRSPRVLWAGVSGPPPEMLVLAEAVRGALRRCALPVEDRPFRAHVTIGRVRSLCSADALTSAWASDKNAGFGDAVADRILLMARAEAGAARYRVLHEAVLKG